ncbi:type I-E CRISPR-associated protein Cas7/Cse4/CasC [Rhodospirillum rubrum]|uniref:CRISPR-associated protein, Cse4 family n=1 Tax=Rhodospirillum rubrum (strain ATCC 11170 / ATH 1.1.1 / DSM 467 / LMG 4362 / NCIMB 8255 / S1) TaxID=269796 RepID=Q2RY18_RHORT|nr:type I-E CRISPR-associated protein Cas7/Cse4/CasC [Rhodospirillum rubrum]ABC20977.1 CRISPR-associated protein, Cse4 family [Rhodospirillum rubrum ATCC 11170]AEO46642.1 CRISPR-associated Cse4 family protein [Rhodospirillum rubrum F11]MBK5952531.1 type I-E CRISPR-associated protein Cas7/Cse4/CasC [Rhodospirillum rubrum]QXG80674.1 type I-E CRISPR-associated protein Cas7/Cse4/CasC [Rhodospirillum rubrum]HAP98608.1 type I-E CRISPR-associated protein Cas7/Cse4/CasC [Rhodospirillum rubrum]
MSRFLQLHVLTAYAASNLNRDDTGRPKTLNFGGAERLRVSSQSLKRAFRQSELFQSRLPGELGTRSQDFAKALVSALVARGVEEAEAITRAEALIDHDKLGKVKKGKAQTEQLVHLGPDELAAIDALAERLATSATLDDKAMLVLKSKPRAVDIAMFGRMLAGNPGFNVEAAVQVAHAFTTHRATPEDDYYTTVDDIKNADQEEDRGAGFLGILEYGSGLFYLYICINADLLVDNLAGDQALAAEAAALLIEAACTISPTGKQNTFASRARGLYALLEIGEETPRSLAAAFQYAVGSRATEADHLAASIQRLTALREGFSKAYGENLRSVALDVTDPATPGLKALIAAARDAVCPPTGQ